jgi:hypothetical protein
MSAIAPQAYIAVFVDAREARSLIGLDITPNDEDVVAIL